MVAYMIVPEQVPLDNTYVDARVRIMFTDDSGNVPAVYCKDLFKSELQGESTSPFFSKFVGRGGYIESMLAAEQRESHEWICPSMTRPSNSLKMEVRSCVDSYV
mmetsp:Transcript_15982/g.20214  ORF Transcript_15982/g.20214 Transcript_15982/m.20214 type:complete len:104 (+) Transcript_15982:248-559(+)|eukprot:CAMPEP_0170473228 /NCGR_PEP_ID=MMETSP0123-20130129/15165_1 /TAXON_ID=182087 /ORGANISM="Favella ehrenbergii, Strain Fehren 1" /LENGTH=103 /DNA_ID=CAMNT_0010742101 /DNA_START=161 /DNA_END=472 /DNA_ORIENTATION=-